jgi:hypothetical protein
LARGLDGEAAVLLLVAMTPRAANPEILAAEDVVVAGPRFIQLDIHGGEVVLAGKFGHWLPVSLQTGGPDSEAQVVFDVTSPGPANDVGQVFSFTSSEVKRTGKGTYLATGTMRRGDITRDAQAVLQTPLAHSPFAAVTFHVDEGAFPEVWSELSARVADPVDETEVRPWAWLRPPELAAA